MLILTNADIEGLLTIGEAIEALRVSNREIAAMRAEKGFALNRPRSNCYLPWDVEGPEAERILSQGGGEDPSVVFTFKSMEGGCRHFGVWAVRASADLVRSSMGPRGPRQDFLRHGDLPGGKGYSDLVFLYSTHDGQFEAILHAAVLQGIRVAATSALGVDVLCRHEVRRMGLIGSGWQAGANLRALRHIRPGIERVQVFSPNPDNRAAFARRMAEELDLEVVPVTRPEEAVIGMDLVCEASSASLPVFDGALLEPGQHLVSVGAGDAVFKRRPIDPRGLGRCAMIGVHTLEVRAGLEEIDDAVTAGLARWDDVVDLPRLVTEGPPRPLGEADITLFKNNAGLGSQFAAVGGLVLRKAKATGLGVEIPQDLVAQVMSR